MLIGRAPVRISFAGGGTDLEEYYSQYEGLVVSATINKYVYGIVTPNVNGDCQVISSDYQSVLEAHPGLDGGTDGDLGLARAVLDEFDAPTSTNVFLASEVPPGTGLGCSGAVGVNLISILANLFERPMSRREIAELAFHIEVKKLGAPVGKQDQYISAYGGLNQIRFTNGGVHIAPLALPRSTIEELQRNLMLFFTGNSRSAWEVLRQQRDATSGRKPIVVEALHQIKRLAEQSIKALEAGDLDVFGRLLDESWRFKKQLASGISNKSIEEIYGLVMEAGALGGKITGAGGGGFLLVYCQPQAQAEVHRALSARGLHQMHFAFESEGVRIIMNSGVNVPEKVGVRV